MKALVQVFAVERKESVYEGGRKSVRYICQCLVPGQKAEVGVLRVPADLVGGDEAKVEPGVYEAEYAIAVDWKTRDIGGKLISFVAVGPLRVQLPSTKDKAVAPTA